MNGELESEATDSFADDSLADAQEQLRKRLIDSGRLIATGVEGLFGRDAMFEAVVRSINQLVQKAGALDNPEFVEFPPMIPMDDFNQIGYLRNFPNLVGPVFSFNGDQTDHQEVLRRLDADLPYEDLLSQTDIALTPACCYPVYPMLRGDLATGGRNIETMGYCFRNEPSRDPMRMQAFRQHEHIRIAEAETVVEWRTQWLDRAPNLIDDLGLDVVVEVATDPFFGRAGRLMKASQRDLQLKMEFLVDVYGANNRTACASINHHRDHFGAMFQIRTADESIAHSACIGFGLERLTVAMFNRHGIDVGAWPTGVRRLLDLS